MFGGGTPEDIVSSDYSLIFWSREGNKRVLLDFGGKCEGIYGVVECHVIRAPNYLGAGSGTGQAENFSLKEDGEVT